MTSGEALSLNGRTPACCNHQAKTLLDTYKESMLCEIKEYSLLLYNIFRKAEIRFEEDMQMTLILEDTLIARESQDELICNLP